MPKGHFLHETGITGILKTVSFTETVEIVDHSSVFLAIIADLGISH